MNDSTIPSLKPMGKFYRPGIPIVRSFEEMLESLLSSSLDISFTASAFKVVRPRGLCFLSFLLYSRPSLI